MKKRILAGAAALCLAGSSIPAQAGELITDLTGDGVLTCTDAIAMQKYLLGLGSLTKAQRAAADLNMDGRVNAFDYAMMKRSLLAKNAPVRYGRIDAFAGTDAFWDAAYAGENAVITSRTELEAWIAGMADSDDASAQRLLETYDDAYFAANTLHLLPMIQGCGGECMYEITGILVSDGILQIRYADTYEADMSYVDVVSLLLGEVSIPKALYDGKTAVWNQIQQEGSIASWSTQEIPVNADAVQSGEGFIIQSAQEYMEMLHQYVPADADYTAVDPAYFAKYTILVLPCGLLDASDIREVTSINREGDTIRVSMDVVEQDTLGGSCLYMVHIPKTDVTKICWDVRYLTELENTGGIRVESVNTLISSYAPYNRYAQLFDNADDFHRFLHSFGAQAFYEPGEVMHAMIADPENPGEYTCITIEMPIVRAWNNGRELEISDPSLLQELMETVVLEDSLRTDMLLTTEMLEACMGSGDAARVTYPQGMDLMCGEEIVRAQELLLLADEKNAWLQISADAGTWVYEMPAELLAEVRAVLYESVKKDLTVVPDVASLELIYGDAFFEKYKLVAVHYAGGADIVSLAPEVDYSSCLSLTLALKTDYSDTGELLLAAIPIEDCAEVTHLFVDER